LTIPLPENLLPGEAASIALSFQLNLPNQNAPFGYTDRQTNLGDWYPYVPPYVPGEGWLVREDAFLGEHLAYDMAEFLVEIQLANPASANGGELVLAASSAPARDGEVYRFHHKPARNFAWTVSDLYQVLETQIGDVQVKGYSFPFHTQADGPALDETANSLAVFSEIFGPYPHQSLSVVEADFLDGMEYDGLVFLSHAFYDFYTGDPRSNLTIIAAHEVAHQWFYGLVGNDQALEPWLDEALSTYSEVYFYEQAYPELVDWWWENRINFHNPQGWVDSTIYEASGFYPYRDAVYLRGAMFLGELREEMGEEAFLAFLRDYLENYRASQVSGDDFFDLLSTHTSEDLSGLIAIYFSRR
jgi:aminopeptidase N